MRARASAHSFVGRRRHNEDAIHVDAARGLFLVADGMGGYDGGEVASRLAVDSVRRFYERVTRVDLEPASDRETEETRLDLAFRIAHREVSRRRVGSLAEMGSTLVALLAHGDHALVAHVGDSRVYRMRHGLLERLTRDHSVYSDLRATGAAITVQQRAFAHVVTRAIGVDGRAEPDVQTVDLRSGDMFLLCTDGLTDVVPDQRIAAILRQVEEELGAVSLTTRAYTAGSRDNITAVVVRVD